MPFRYYCVFLGLLGASSLWAETVHNERPAAEVAPSSSGGTRRSYMARFAVSGKTTKAFAESADLFLRSPAVTEVLSRLSDSVRGDVSDVANAVELAKRNPASTSLAELLVPPLQVKLAENTFAIVSSVPNAPMLYVKNDVAVGGTTTKEDIDQYVRAYRGQTDEADFLKGVVFIPADEKIARDTYIVLRNPFYGGNGKDATPESVRRYLAENVIDAKSSKRKPASIVGAKIRE